VKLKQHTDFQPEQIVWAKAKGHYWRPAVINYAIVDTDESGAIKKDYMVTFIGTDES